MIWYPERACKARCKKEKHKEKAENGAIYKSFPYLNMNPVFWRLVPSPQYLLLFFSSEVRTSSYRVVTSLCGLSWELLGAARKEVRWKVNFYLGWMNFWHSDFWGFNWVFLTADLVIWEVLLLWTITMFLIKVLLRSCLLCKQVVVCISISKSVFLYFFMLFLVTLR